METREMSKLLQPMVTASPRDVVVRGGITNPRTPRRFTGAVLALHPCEWVLRVQGARKGARPFPACTSLHFLEFVVGVRGFAGTRCWSIAPGEDRLLTRSSRSSSEA